MSTVTKDMTISLLEQHVGMCEFSDITLMVVSELDVQWLTQHRRQFFLQDINHAFVTAV